MTTDDPRPSYVQIADELGEAILSGTLAPGQRLQSGRVLAETYRVSPMTIQQAMRELRERGLVVAWQGRGVFVADELPKAADDLQEQVSSLRKELSSLARRVAALETKTPPVESNGSHGSRARS